MLPKTNADGPKADLVIDLREPMAAAVPALVCPLDEPEVRWVSPEALGALVGPGTEPWFDKWVIRIGIASIFAVNAIVAFVTPGDFQDMLAENLIGRELPTGLRTAMVAGAGVNDALLAVAILVFGHHRLVWLWTALWLMAVGAVKLMNLIA